MNRAELIRESRRASDETFGFESRPIKNKPSLVVRIRRIEILILYLHRDPIKRNAQDQVERD